MRVYSFKITISSFSFFFSYFQVTHWQSPYMHAYFPALNCFPSLLGDMLADAINCLGFTWVSQFVTLKVQENSLLRGNSYLLSDRAFLKGKNMFLKRAYSFHYDYVPHGKTR